MTPPGWFMNPADARTALASNLLAREQLYKYRAWRDQLVARQQLRERMGRIITIDRAGTSRSVGAERQASRHGVDTGSVS